MAAFISISELSETVLRPYLPPGRPVHRVSNPVDLQQRPPADPASSDRFTFVGRLAPEKGPALLATSAAAGGFPVTFAGDGTERETLISIAPDAEFTGWLGPNEVESVLRSSRALVFPSVWYETQGLTVLEAAALGIPAIVSSETAAREAIEDGVTGLLFRHGDVEDLQRKMQLLHAAPLLAGQMGRNAYERYWRSPYTMDRHCTALEEVYAQTLDARSGESRVLLRQELAKR